MHYEATQRPSRNGKRKDKAIDESSVAQDYQDQGRYSPMTPFVLRYNHDISASMINLRVIRFILLLLLIISSVMYYHPLYYSVSVLLVPLTLLILALSFNSQNVLHIGFFKNSIGFALFATLIYFILYSVNKESNYIDDIKNIWMSIIFIVIGFQLRFTAKEIFFFCILFIIFSLITVSSQVFMNIGGLIIVDQYLVDEKNSLGVISISAAVACLYLAIHRCFTKRWQIAILLITSISLFILTVTIRARTSMLIYILLCSLMTIQSWNSISNTRKLSLIIIASILIVFLFPFVESFGTFIYDSLTKSHEDNLTSARLERNMMAINIFLDDPLWGCLSSDTKIPWVHNYLLRIISSFGILGGSFFIMYYFYFGGVVIKCLLINNYSYEYIGFYIILVPLLTSFSEPTFPFGPGSAVLFPMLCLGYSLNAVYNDIDSDMTIMY